MKNPFALSQISLALIWKRLTFQACSSRRCWYAIAFEQASAKEELGRGEAGRPVPKCPNLPLLFFRRRFLVIFSTFPSPKRNAYQRVERKIILICQNFPTFAAANQIPFRTGQFVCTCSQKLLKFKWHFCLFASSQTKSSNKLRLRSTDNII